MRASRGERAHVEERNPKEVGLVVREGRREVGEAGWEPMREMPLHRRHVVEAAVAVAWPAERHQGEPYGGEREGDDGARMMAEAARHHLPRRHPFAEDAEGADRAEEDEDASVERRDELPRLENEYGCREAEPEAREPVVGRARRPTAETANEGADADETERHTDPCREHEPGAVRNQIAR